MLLDGLESVDLEATATPKLELLSVKWWICGNLFSLSKKCGNLFWPIILAWTIPLSKGDN
jgi:hypothetical protein